MSYSSQPVIHRIIPCTVYMVIASVQLKNIPCMVHGIASGYMALQPHLIHNVGICISIGLADSDFISDNPSAAEGILWKCIRQKVIIIIFVLIYKIVMNSQCFCLIVHFVGNLLHNLAYITVNTQAVCFCLLQGHGIFNLNTGIGIRQRVIVAVQVNPIAEIGRKVYKPVDLIIRGIYIHICYIKLRFSLQKSGFHLPFQL